MIQYFSHKNIDFRKWDACLDQAINGNIYAYSWYLNAACETWDALIEDDYESIMPLPYRKKLFIHYVFPPSMTQQLGIFSLKNISEDKVSEFIQNIPSKFKYCDINLNHYNHLQDNSFNTSTHINLELNLNLPYTELSAAFAENTLRNIKKASKKDIRIHKIGDIQHLIQLFIQSKADKIEHLPKDYYDVIEKLAGVLLQRGQAEIWEARLDDEICAGVLFAFNQNKAYFLFSATNATAKENGVMPFLIDTFIKENAGKNLILDFEGSDNTNLARFYKSFGGIEKNYQKIVINRIPTLLFTLIKKLRKK